MYIINKGGRAQIYNSSPVRCCPAAVLLVSSHHIQSLVLHWPPTSSSAGQYLVTIHAASGTTPLLLSANERPVTMHHWLQDFYTGLRSLMFYMAAMFN